jgi:CRISPR-associated exonuclease Cas4
MVSRKLGLYGRADIVEWRKTSDEDRNAVLLPGCEGKWKPMPVEYKRGKPKPDERDEVQLCAQAVCLEEAHNITIEKGSLYYGETRHRQEVVLDATLRNKVEGYALRMHQLYNGNFTPLPVYKSHCKSCSLYDSCLPKQIANSQSVDDYLKNMLNEEI